MRRGRYCPFQVSRVGLLRRTLPPRGRLRAQPHTRRRTLRSLYLTPHTRDIAAGVVLRTHRRISHRQDFLSRILSSASPSQEAKRLAPLVSPGAGKGQRAAAACAGTTAVMPASLGDTSPRSPTDARSPTSPTACAMVPTHPWSSARDSKEHRQDTRARRRYRKDAVVLAARRSPRGLRQPGLPYHGISRPVQCVSPTASFSE